MWVRTTRLAPARRACSPASAGVMWPRIPVRSGRGSVASTISRSVSRGDLDQLLAGAAVGAVGEPAAAVGRAEVDREGVGEVRHLAGSGPGAGRPRPSSRRRTPRARTRSRSGPRCPTTPTSRRKVSCAPWGAISRGRAGSSVPGPAGDRHRLLARRVGERVGVGDQVEEVVGVQVGDQHRVDVGVVAERRSFENTPLPQSSSSGRRRPRPGSRCRRRRRPARRATCRAP